MTLSQKNPNRHRLELIRDALAIAATHTPSKPAKTQELVMGARLSWLQFLNIRDTLVALECVTLDEKNRWTVTPRGREQLALLNKVCKMIPTESKARLKLARISNSNPNPSPGPKSVVRTKAKAISMVAGRRTAS